MRRVIELETHLKELNTLVKSFPSLKYGVLSFVAKRGRILLKNSYLSGQYINLRRSDTDSKGVNLVTGRTGKRSSVIFSSYPLNLFERGRTLRDGRTESGRYILTKKFRGGLDAKLQTFTNQAQKRILNPMIEKASK